MNTVNSFLPIEDTECTILILGTAPSKVSLKKHEYYGNPNNIFWDIIFHALEDNILDGPILKDYEEKQSILLKNHIALWDVINYCERETNLDIDIKEEVLNDFKIFISSHPKIRTIIFNGKQAEKLFISFKASLPSSLHYIQLESTSPSNRKNPFYKLKQWKDELRKHMEYLS